MLFNNYKSTYVIAGCLTISAIGFGVYHYQKKNDTSLGKPRRVHALPPEWLKEWNLVDRIQNMTEDDLPVKTSANVGEACRKYLSGKPVWKAIKENKAIIPYSFRHGWSLRSHLDFGLSDKARRAAARASSKRLPSWARRARPIWPRKAVSCAFVSD